MKKNKNLIIALSALMTFGSSLTVLAATGWQEQNGNWKFYDKDGYAVTDTWKQSGDHYYYLSDNGYMAKDTLIDDGTYYYIVNKDGVRLTNQWAQAKDDDGEVHWYYLQSSGKAKMDGFLTIDGQRYHFTDGKMDEGWLQVDENTYYLNRKHDGTYGSVVAGWVYVDEFNDDDEVTASEEGWYYFNSNGKMVSGIEKKINGKHYVFDNEGLMLDNWVEFVATSSGADVERIYKYYRSSEGDRMDGWVYVDDMSEDEGRETEEGWYYFKNGIAYSAAYKTTEIAEGYGVAKINGKIYCFDTDGRMVTGKVDGSDGTYFYFEEANENGTMKSGRVTITNSDDLDEGTYHFADKGSVGEKGKSTTGVIKGYLYNNGELIKADSGQKYEKVTVAGKNYLVNQSGKVKTSGTVKDGDGVKWTVTTDAAGDYVITRE